MTSDPWTPSGQVQPDVNTLTRMAADQAYEAAGIGPEDLDLVELHDCFATAELIHYDNLRLCDPGGAGDFIDSGAPTRDGALPVNVSGGLLSKGHPIGATGIANLYEVVDPSARRGRRPSSRRGQGWSDSCDWPCVCLRRPRAGSAGGMIPRRS